MLSLNSSFLLCNSVVWGLLVLLMGTAAMGIYCMGLLCCCFFFSSLNTSHCNHQFVTFLTHLIEPSHFFSHRSTRSINSGPAFHSLFFVMEWNLSRFTNILCPPTPDSYFRLHSLTVCVNFFSQSCLLNLSCCMFTKSKWRDSSPVHSCDMYLGWLCLV